MSNEEINVMSQSQMIRMINFDAPYQTIITFLSMSLNNITTYQLNCDISLLMSLSMLCTKSMDHLHVQVETVSITMRCPISNIYYFVVQQYKYRTNQF